MAQASTLSVRPVAARRRPRTSKASFVALGFAAPALIVYGVFLLYPAIYSIRISFTNWDGLSPVMKFVGLSNYAKMFKDPVMQTAVKNNIIWALVTIIVPMVMGFVLALAVNSKVYFRPFIRTIFYLPAVLPLVGVGTIWNWLFQPGGVINQLLDLVGLGSLQNAWLGDSSTAIWAITIPACWVGTGFPMLLYLAALQGIPSEYYESARVDGASWWQQLRYITLPSLSAAHAIILALSLINAAKVFDLVFAMTNGGPGNATQVMGTWMYFNVFQSYNAGYGTAIAVVITLVAVLIGIPYVRAQAKAIK